MVVIVRLMTGSAAMLNVGLATHSLPTRTKKESMLMGSCDVSVESVPATELHDASRMLLDGLGVSFFELEV